MKKLYCIIWVGFLLLMGGCGFVESQKSDTNNLPDNSQFNIADIIPNKEQKVYGSIEITDEIRGKFFDLARAQRWDFLPLFNVGETPTEVSDYINWIMCQAQVWAGFDEPDKDLTPEELSKEYVEEIISRHFNIDVPMPMTACNVDGFEFDGDKFMVWVGGWANLPDYELTDLSVDNINGIDVYTAKLLQYNNHGGLTETDRNTIIQGNADKSDVYVFRWREIQFYINESNNEIVFISVNGGNTPI